MKRIILFVVVISLFSFSLTSGVYARSGCCSYHGGVCGCGCCDGSPLSSTCAPYYPECNSGYNSYSAPPSCPAMSTYNSLTDKCECLSGYVVSGSSCISANQWCKNKYGYNSEHDSLNDNCKCAYGYVWNSSVTKCIGNDESCQNEYGYNSKSTIMGDKCECKSGYSFNKAGTKCITQNSACQEMNGLMSEYDTLNNTCVCLNGYEFDGSDCMKKVIVIPTKIALPTTVPMDTNRTIKISPIQSETTETKPTEEIVDLISSNNNQGTLALLIQQILNLLFK